MELIAVIVATISAIAASIAAWNARRGIQISQRAFVYAEPAIKTQPTESDGGGGFLSERESHVELRLFNDGPGTALDVRVRLETEAGDQSAIQRHPFAHSDRVRLCRLRMANRVFHLPCRTCRSPGPRWCDTERLAVPRGRSATPATLPVSR
jgi:hypothetical protein